MGSHGELYITKVLKILFGQSLKISIMVSTTRNNKKLQWTCSKTWLDCEHPKNAQFDMYAITSNSFNKFQ